MFDTFWQRFWKPLSRRARHSEEVLATSNRRTRRQHRPSGAWRIRPLVEPLEERVVLDALRWVGGGVTNDWSSDSAGLTNWFDQTTMTGTDALPHNGDDLIFDNTAIGFRANNNNFFNLQVNSIAITGDNYFISGSPLILTGAAGLSCNAPSTGPILNTDLILATGLSFTNNGLPALLGGNLDLNSRGLTINGIGNFNISNSNGRGIISSSAAGDSLTMAGSGILFLEGANTYDGPTTIMTGEVEDRNSTGLGAGPVTVLSGATLVLDGGAGTLSIPENLSVAGSGISNSGAIFNFLGANTLTGTINLAADTTLSLASSMPLTIQGMIGGNGALTLIAGSGAGSLILSGTNNYQGGTIINSGTLQTGAANAIPMTSDVLLSLSGAALVLNNFNQTIGSLVGADGTTVNLGSATLAVGASNNANANFAGTIGGTGGLTKIGTGQQGLIGSSANTFTGLTTVNAGTLLLGKAAGITAVGGNVVIGDGSGGRNAAVLQTANGNHSANARVTINSSGLFDLVSGGQVFGELFGSGNVTLDSSGSQLTVGDSGDSTFRGAITETGGPSGGVTKIGTGSLTLSGSNTYTGPTLIAAGTLVVNGNLTASPLRLMGGTLAGTGSLGDVTATGGTLAPGVGGIGLLAVHNLVLNASTTFRVALNGPNAGSGFSQLIVTGTIDLGGSTLVATLGFTPAPNTSLAIIKNSGPGAVRGAFNNLPEGQTFSIGGQSFQVSYRGGAGNDVVVRSPLVVSPPPIIRLFVIGGAPGRVQVRGASDNSLVADFAPYGSAYTGPISVAIGDVNGDGFPDIITGAKVGNPDVRVFNGKAFANGTFDPNNPNASLLAEFFPYALNFNVGVNVAVGDIEHNGFADIVTGPTAGNPDVRVYRGKDIAQGTFNPAGASLLAQWFPYALQFNVGANVAVGDVNGDGFADVVTGATAGNPDVRVYNGQDIANKTFNPTGGSLLAQFFAYALQFNVGAFVAVGDTTGSGFGDIITGATVGNPDVRVFRGQDIAQGTFQNSNLNASLLTQFFAYGLNFNVGAAVASADFENNGRFDIITGASIGSPHYRIVKGNATGTMPPALLEGIPNDLQGGISVGARGQAAVRPEL